MLRGHHFINNDWRAILASILLLPGKTKAHIQSIGKKKKDCISTSSRVAALCVYMFPTRVVLHFIFGACASLIHSIPPLPPLPSRK